MNLHLLAVAWTVIDTEGRHLSDEISCRDPCPVRLSTCFAQGILAYHCFPPGCWQGPVSCWTLMNASSLVSHMPEIIKSLPAHTGKNLRRSSGPTSRGKRAPKWDYISPCPTASWNLLMMATLPCPWGHCYRDWCYCEILLSNIKMKPLLRKSVPVISCLLHEAPCEDRVSILFVPTLW